MITKKFILIAAITFIIGIASGIAGMFIYLKYASSPNDLAMSGSENSAQEMMPSDYAKNGVSIEEAQKSKKPAAVLFFVNWCHYCKSFAPVYEEMRKEYSSKFNFVFVDCDDPANQKLMSEYGVNSFPSLYLVNMQTKTKEYIEPYKYHQKDEMKSILDNFATKK